MERDLFLARVLQGVARADLPEVADPGPLAKLPEVDLVEMFRLRAQTENTVVHGPMPRHSVPRSVAGIAAGHQISTFATWDDLPAAGVAGALSAEGYHRVEAGPPEEFDTPAHAGVDFGVTGASAALAESGSVVLRHHSGRSRLLSTLPAVHVALVSVGRVFRTLVEWVSRYPESIEGTANLVIVTGPSRTADIEQTLNVGVHGPKHVHVVLIR